LKDTIDKISLGKYLLEGEFWINISDDAKDMINGLLQLDPNNRLSAFEAKKHKWLKSSLSSNSNELLKQSIKDVEIINKIRNKQNSVKTEKNTTKTFAYPGLEGNYTTCQDFTINIDDHPEIISPTLTKKCRSKSFN
jgi:serine/threonine protein kinase